MKPNLTLNYQNVDYENPVNRQPEQEAPAKDILDLINPLEGVKTRIKNLHWINKINMHRLYDELADLVSKYEDSMAEDWQGINGLLELDDVQAVECNAADYPELFEEIEAIVVDFYQNCLDGVDIRYNGMKSESDTFIHDLHVQKYLFDLAAMDR